MKQQYLNFAERLQNFRLRSGLSQMRLATEARVGKGSIYRWENGRCVPGPEETKRLCTALGVTADELLAGRNVEEEPQSVTTEDVTSQEVKTSQEHSDPVDQQLSVDSESDVNARFAAKIRELRLLAKMPQAEVARQLGCCVTSYCRMEGGQTGPSWLTAVRIARLFNVSLDVLTQKANAVAGAPRCNNASLENLEIGQRILYYRTLKGMNQADLAHALGMQASEISRIERGLKPIHIAKVGAMAAALGVSVNLLITGKE